LFILFLIMMTMISIRSVLFLPLLTSSVIGSDDVFRPFSGRVTSPSDVGAIHTEAFEALADLHSVRKPKDRNELRRNVAGIVTSYLCNDGDSECAKAIKTKTRRQFRKPISVKTWKVPEELDSALKEVVESARSIVGTLRTGENVDDVVNKLETLEEAVKQRKDTDRLHKAVVLSGLSVAKESTKLWNEVYENPEHVLHGMHHDSYYQNNNTDGRTLQQFPLNLAENVPSAILSDSLAAIDGGIAAIGEGVELLFSDPLALILSVMIAIPGEAIMASAAAFLVGDMYDGPDDE